MFSRPNPLLTDPDAALVVLGLLGFLPDHPQRLFQELGGLFAIRPFESHSVNLDLSCGPDDDFDGPVHNRYSPINTSLMDPFC